MKMLRVTGFVLSLSLSFSVLAQEKTEPWKDVDAAMGRTGQVQAGGVYKYAMPRRDLKVTKDGITIAPGLALGSWVAFQKMGDHTMLMGDLVLTENEVEPVMLSLQEHGIEQTAIHNHLLGESPHIVYMHIEGHGDPVTLGKSVAFALTLTRTPPPAAADGSISSISHRHRSGRRRERARLHRQGERRHSSVQRSSDGKDRRRRNGDSSGHGNGHSD